MQANTAKAKYTLCTQLCLTGPAGTIVCVSVNDKETEGVSRTRFLLSFTKSSAKIKK